MFQLRATMTMSIRPVTASSIGRFTYMRDPIPDFTIRQNSPNPSRTWIPETYDTP